MRLLGPVKLSYNKEKINVNIYITNINNSIIFEIYIAFVEIMRYRKVVNKNKNISNVI